MDDKIYANRLAYSMHLAVEENGEFLALNHNSGVFFAKATENADGSLNPKSLKMPWLFPMKEESFGVVCIRTLADGEPDTENVGEILFATTKDLLQYKEVSMICPEAGKQGKLEDVRCCYCKDCDAYVLQWKYEGEAYKEGMVNLQEGRMLDEGKMISDESVFGRETFSGIEKIEGVVPRNTLTISQQLGDYLKKKLLPAKQVGLDIPKEILVNSLEALNGTKVAAVYSDGAKVLKKVRFEKEDVAKIDFSKPGAYNVRGQVYQEHFDFPVALNRADPCVTYWQGKYYFIATNDADNNHTLYLRCSDTLEGIAEAEEHLILDSTTYPGIGGLLWAPEFHEIDGRLYIFHAATPEPFFCEESHVMELREGGNPICREDWSCPKRVVKADGSDLCESGKVISLDMTEFEWEGEYYVIWSQRQFLPKDLGAWLYLAKLNPMKPWMLASEPVVLSKPDYGWANNHTFVDEGPFALLQGRNLHVTFSSAAVDTTYVVGLLTIEPGKDLLDVSNWRKTNYPILTSRSVEGEYGTGHNAYVVDPDGITWNTYHARPGVDAPRSSGIRRVHFDVDGEPKLDVTEELDLVDAYKTFETTVVVNA